MISAIDLHAIRESTQGDLDGLGIYLQQLVGEPFLFFRHSYGDELTIHFGGPIERLSQKLKNRARGSYVISLRGSLWTMIADDRKLLVLPDASPKYNADDFKETSALDIEKSPPLKQGARLVWALPHVDDFSGGIGLSLGFSDQTRLMIRPDPPSVDERDNGSLPEIADWEVRTPIGRYLRVGPGLKWAYLPSRNESDGDHSA